jgi:outer membrane protein OmpA-like peptidoglycan-associated protein
MSDRADCKACQTANGGHKIKGRAAKEGERIHTRKGGQKGGPANGEPYPTPLRESKQIDGLLPLQADLVIVSLLPESPLPFPRQRQPSESMKIPPFKIMFFAVLVALVLLGGRDARAEIVRGTDGTPVLDSAGNCVLNNWEGSEDCDAAKADAGIAATTDKQTTRVQHENVVYFDFNKATLTLQAKHSLDHMAKKLGKMNRHDHGKSHLTIVGYADRIGNADYNQKLAMKRAQAVYAYLKGRGVKAHKIEVRSLGQSDPKANCPPNMKRAALIDCLKEDRRVEIEAVGHQ